MGDKSAIEWTDATWNPTRGCSRVSEGCRNCYAERVAARFSGPGQPYEGLATMARRGPDTKGGRGHLVKQQWTGRVAFVESMLDAPLRWKRPRRIFVNSMSDLFHEKVPDAWIESVFAVMRQARQHTFQILTKRPARMREYLKTHAEPEPWIWLGVSVEDQATADERIPILLQTPAAVRWVSYEPALGPVDFYPWTLGNSLRSLRWIVVGGESGPGARPFDLAWARSTIEMCKAAGVPVFVKQLGALPILKDRFDVSALRFNQLDATGWDEHHGPPTLHDRKGGDPAEWPEDLRVREYPR